MAVPKKISEFPTDAAPGRTDFLTSLEGATVNVKGQVGAYLALTRDTDLTFSDNTTGDVTAFAHGYAPKAPGDASKFLNGASPPAYAYASAPYLQYREEQAQNTNGGTFTSGSWQTRTLNTEVTDTGGHGNLAANQITLDAGTYYAVAHAPAFEVDRHQIRLQNVTAGTTLLVGQSYQAGASDSVTGCAVLMGMFTVAAAQALELQHRCLTTKATTGFGVAANFTTEVYSVIEIWKIA